MALPTSPSSPLAQLDWNDLRAFLALVRGGTLRRASARYALSPATLSRRVDQLEAAVGRQLVERGPTGCQLTVDGRQVFNHAEAMERLASEVLHVRDAGGAAAVEGTVRINADEWISFLLARHVPALRSQYPNLTVELLTTHRPYSLGRGEADIAVRPFRPLSADLVSRAVGTVAFGLYGSAGYVQARADAVRAADWPRLDFVGFDDRHADFDAERWLRSLVDPALPWLRCSYALGIYDGVLAGAGLGVLAQFIAAGDGRLVPVLADIPELRQRHWMAFHRSARHSARVRVVADCIVQALAAA